MQLPASVSIEKQNDNQIITIDNQYSKTKISLFGAQVFSFIRKADGRDRMWLSPLTHTDGRETIRGGTPVCWPWFANQFPNDDTTLPIHGFVRNQLWELFLVEEMNTGTRLVLHCPNTKDKGFEYSAKLTLEVLVEEQLTLSLCTENTDESPFKITGALHTYFAVDDIHQIRMNGLDGSYLDKTRNMQRFQVKKTNSIHEETDRIHFSESSELTLTDEHQQTIITASGHDSIVIWNPWEKAKTVSNMPNDGYLHFVCIEAAITQGIMIPPNELHVLTQIID